MCLSFLPFGVHGGMRKMPQGFVGILSHHNYFRFIYLFIFFVKKHRPNLTQPFSPEQQPVAESVLLHKEPKSCCAQFRLRNFPESTFSII